MPNRKRQRHRCSFALTAKGLFPEGLVECRTLHDGSLQVTTVQDSNAIIESVNFCPFCGERSAVNGIRESRFTRTKSYPSRMWKTIRPATQ